MDRFVVKKRLTVAVKVLSLSATVGPLIFISLAAKRDPFWKVFQQSLWHWPSINLSLFWDVWVDYHTAESSRHERRKMHPCSTRSKATEDFGILFFSSSFHSLVLLCLIKQETGWRSARRENECRWGRMSLTGGDVSARVNWWHLGGSPQSSCCASVPHLSAWTVTFHEQKRDRLSNYHI